MKRIVEELPQLKRLGITKLEDVLHSASDLRITTKTGTSVVNASSFFRALRNGDVSKLKKMLGATDGVLDETLLSKLAKQNKTAILSSVHQAADSVDDTLRTLAKQSDKLKDAEIVGSLNKAGSKVDASVLKKAGVSDEVVEQLKFIEKTIAKGGTKFKSRLFLKLTNVGLVLTAVGVPLGLVLNTLKDANTGCLQYTKFSDGTVGVCRALKYTLVPLRENTFRDRAPIKPCQSVPLPTFDDADAADRPSKSTPMPNHPGCSVLCDDKYLVPDSTESLRRDMGLDDRDALVAFNSLKINPNVTYKCNTPPSPTLPATLSRTLRKTWGSLEKAY
ncbi:hypothetical protein IscW_ISCW010842 [Ixodes scapularis]|uniref:Uncharacterized protein n=1 Tax=Ixodes scapularis TaxID=6945 RepID=B7Q8E8_IXOSC|nr:hypothetical protein IscW_ISCW010842 [Ixodes scapularis]|eukprot:XP_002404985.1 hypothetical protein IscW_ISCW010842 [Ixodes scapularis]